MSHLSSTSRRSCTTPAAPLITSHLPELRVVWQVISGGLLGGIEASKFELFGEDVHIDRPVITGLPSAEWQPKEPWLQRAPRRVRLASRGANTACC